MEEKSGRHMEGRGNQGGDKPQGAEHLYGQARDALSDVADRASEMWDEVYDQGRRYYRQSSRAVGDLDGSTVALALIAGAIGYAVAYLVHGHQYHSGRDSVPDYARTRPGYGRERRSGGNS